MIYIYKKFNQRGLSLKVTIRAKSCSISMYIQCKWGFAWLVSAQLYPHFCDWLAGNGKKITVNSKGKKYYDTDLYQL